MNNIDCKIKKYPRDTRTEWLVIETEDFAKNPDNKAGK